MKIKILKIIKTNEVFHGTSKAGKTYDLYQWFCDIDNNGMQSKYVVKTMSKITADSFKEGNEYEVDEQVFNNTVSYMIKKNENKSVFQKKPFYQQGKMSESEYFSFVRKAFALTKELAGTEKELIVPVFDKILGCGCVLVDTNKENKTTDVVNKTFNNDIQEDENIPF